MHDYNPNFPSNGNRSRVTHDQGGNTTIDYGSQASTLDGMMDQSSKKTVDDYKNTANARNLVGVSDKGNSARIMSSSFNQLPASNIDFNTDEVTSLQTCTTPGTSLEDGEIQAGTQSVYTVTREQLQANAERDYGFGFSASMIASESAPLGNTHTNLPANPPGEQEATSSESRMPPLPTPRLEVAGADGSAYDDPTFMSGLRKTYKKAHPDVKYEINELEGNIFDYLMTVKGEKTAEHIKMISNEYALVRMIDDTEERNKHLTYLGKWYIGNSTKKPIRDHILEILHSDKALRSRVKTRSSKKW
jgi:hypothetical protein